MRLVDIDDIRVMRFPTEEEDPSESDFEGNYREGWNDALIAIDEIQPSAEPEIIRCKDCKHKHLENMVWTCPFGLSGGENFFCGYGAEPYKGGQGEADD